MAKCVTYNPTCSCVTCSFQKSLLCAKFFKHAFALGLNVEEPIAFRNERFQVFTFVYLSTYNEVKVHVAFSDCSSQSIPFEKYLSLTKSDIDAFCQKLVKINTIDADLARQLAQVKVDREQLIKSTFCP